MARSRWAARVCRRAASAALLLVASSKAAANVTATWLAPTSDFWTTAARWSSSPYAPFNESPAGSHYDVVIDAAGSPYSIRLDKTTDQVLSSLLINSADATAVQEETGRLTVLGTFDLRAGAWRFAASSGGSVNGLVSSSVTSSLGQGAMWADPGSSVAFRDTSIGGVPLTVQSSFFSAAAVQLLGTTTINDVLSLRGATNSAYATVTHAYLTAQSLDGTGAVVFDDLWATIQSPLPSITIAPTMTLRTGGGSGVISADSITNKGRLIVATPGRQIDASYSNLDNQGVVEVRNGGTLSIADLVNSGSIVVDHATLNLRSFTTSQLAGMVEDDATINVTGDVNNAGAVFHARWRLGANPNGTPTTITGGSIVSTDGAALNVTSGVARLDGGILDADLIVHPGALFALSPTSTFAPNHTVSLRAGTPYSGLSFDGQQAPARTVAGPLEIRFDGDPSQKAVLIGALTLGPAVTIRTGSASGTLVGTMLNQGAIIADGPGRTISLDGRFTNAGRIELKNGATLQLAGQAGLVNNGTIKASFGTLRFAPPYTDWTNNGTVDALGTPLTIAGTTTLNSLAGIIAPEIRLGAGSVITLASGLSPTLPLTVQGGASLVVGSANLTLTPGAPVKLAASGGTAALSFDVSTDVTIGGAGEIQMGGGTGGTNFISVNLFRKITFGPNVTLRTGPGGGTVGNTATPLASSVFDGSVIADGTGNTLKLLGAVSNRGLFRATNGGTIDIPYAVNTSPGRWEVYNDSLIRFPAGSGIVTNIANVLVSGPRAAFPALATVKTNQNALTFDDEAAFTTAAALANAGTLTLGAGARVTVSGVLSGTGTASVAASATLRAAAFRQNALTVAGAALVVPKATGGDTSALKALTIASQAGAWTGQLDLADNALAIDYTGQSPVLTVADQIRSGRAGGAWTGNGITSSLADSTKVLGYAEAADVLDFAGAPTALWQGQTVDPTTVLVRYTILGDANLDGRVGFPDLVAVAQRYDTLDGSGTWFTGDFNYDGKINFADLVAVAQNYDQSLAPSAPLPGAPADFAADLAAASATVPEPGFAAGAQFALAPLLLRRRRRRCAPRSAGAHHRARQSV